MNKKQSGFTLIEVMVVIMILGVMAAIIFSNTGNPSAKGEGLLIDRVARSSMDSWAMVNMSCGTTTAVDSSPVLVGIAAERQTENLGKLVFAGDNGDSWTTATYEACYNSSGVRPNNKDASFNGTNWLIAGKWPVTFAGGGSAAFQVNVAGVPETVARVLAQKIQLDADIAGFTVDTPTLADGGTTIGTSAPLVITKRANGYDLSVRSRL